MPFNAFVYLVPCRTCDASGSEHCHTQTGAPRRWPHGRRLATAGLRDAMTSVLGVHNPALMTYIVHDIATAERLDSTGLDVAKVTNQLDEFIALRSAQHHQHLTKASLRSIDGCTLDLGELRARAGSLADDLDAALKATALVHGGLVAPDGPARHDGPPTPGEVARWAELAAIEALRECATQRDQAAVEVLADAEPARWTVTDALANGCFSASDTKGTIVEGWAEVPDAVSDALRAWSVPAGAPVDIDWATPPPQPARRLPSWGWLPDHPGNVPDLDGITGRPDPYEAWRAQPPEAIDAFADALQALRETWSLDDDIPAKLDAAAKQLNIAEPQAPSIHQILEDASPFAVTVATEWINPATVAHSGRHQWNDFGEHRPDQPENFTRSLLACTNPAEGAQDIWACPHEPVDLYRVPGPAGPLYQLGVNGQHRIHTARMLNFQLLWAVVTQTTLPVTLSWTSLDHADERRAGQPTEAVTIWEGLRRRGLLVGEIDRDTATLMPYWVAAPWLLASAATAVQWAHNYQRAYPGTLTALGIPTAALTDAHNWASWLTAPIP